MLRLQGSVRGGCDTTQLYSKLLLFYKYLGNDQKMLTFSFVIFFYNRKYVQYKYKYVQQESIHKKGSVNLLNLMVYIGNICYRVITYIKGAVRRPVCLLTSYDFMSP